jgi:SAM-dependent methyltransferase
MSQKQADDIRQSVRDSYAKVAEANNAGECCGVESSCCGVSADINAVHSTRLGYSEDDIINIPDGADMGLGCGNPRAIAGLQADEVVLDLGSGGGFDAFLAVREVGERGRVIGVDMTPAMVTKARHNAEKAGLNNVEFRLGEIEYLPVADGCVDVIISNCVVNLSPDKSRVFSEAFRVLKPGGRLAISDVVATAELPNEVQEDPHLHACCVAGAALVDELQAILEEAGFSEILITPKDESREFIRDWVPGSGVEDYVVSAHIEAVKPV